MKEKNVGDILNLALNPSAPILTTSIKLVFTLGFAILGHWLGTKINNDYNRWDNQSPS
ncbi:MAG: hypothetical protein Q4G59_10035 [Planctomycetia bacterium]|nr:hypothetical protein [Planctomycetia bacterium]